MTSIEKRKAKKRTWDDFISFMPKKKRSAGTVSLDRRTDTMEKVTQKARIAPDTSFSSRAKIRRKTQKAPNNIINSEAVQHLTCNNKINSEGVQHVTSNNKINSEAKVHYVTPNNKINKAKVQQKIHTDTFNLEKPTKNCNNNFGLYIESNSSEVVVKLEQSSHEQVGEGSSCSLLQFKQGCETISNMEDHSRTTKVCTDRECTSDFHSCSSSSSRKKRGCTPCNNITIRSEISDVGAETKQVYKSTNRLEFLRCVTCKCRCLRKQPFLKHLKMHQNKRFFQCFTCQKKQFSSFSYTRCLRKFHWHKKAHFFNKCNRGFCSSCQMRLHLTRHGGSHNFRFSCGEYDRSFPYKHLLSKHLRSEHPRTQKRKSLPFSCKVCGKSFGDRKNLLVHWKRHSDAVQPYRCHFCGVAFAMHRWLVDHVQTHFPERNYPCSMCGKRYFTRSDASMHERRHTKEATFSCSECDKKFIYRSELNAHLKRHQGIPLPRNIMCDICSKAFSTRRDLERHLTVHTGEKPYKCHVCSKCFSQEVNMQVHLKIHSGERPYQCDICDKRFIAKSKLARHRQCHLTSKGMLPRPFKCILCPRKYTVETSLIRHLKTHRDSAETVASIKAALKKAVEESSTAQAAAGAGAVLACMIDQAILDTRSMARNGQNHKAKGGQSLTEIIDQAIHDSKASSSPCKPAVTENTLRSVYLSPSDTGENAATAEGSTGKNDDTSETSTSISTNTNSHPIKLTQENLGHSLDTDQGLSAAPSILNSVTHLSKPFSSETIMIKPKSPVASPHLSARTTKHGGQGLQLHGHELIQPGRMKSFLESNNAPHDITSFCQNIHPASESCNGEQIHVQSLTTDRSPQSRLLVAVGEQASSELEQRIVLVDCFSKQQHFLQSSVSSPANTVQQDMLSLDGKGTLMIVPSSSDVSSHLPTNQAQHVLPENTAGLARKESFFLMPSDSGLKVHSVSLASASPSKMHPVILKTFGSRTILIPSSLISLNESCHLPTVVTSAGSASAHDQNLVFKSN